LIGDQALQVMTPGERQFMLARHTRTNAIRRSAAHARRITLFVFAAALAVLISDRIASAATTIRSRACRSWERFSALPAAALSAFNALERTPNGMPTPLPSPP